MAGKGTRLRPQTLTTPKPLIRIAGKTIVQRIVDVVTKNQKHIIKNVGFIIERPNLEIETTLHSIGEKTGIKTHVFYQKKAEGTAHAIYCAKKLLFGPTMIIFSDTLFETELVFSDNLDGCILVKEVENPRAYGVVKLNNQGHIVEFLEKPKKPVSNLAIVGIYYFKNGEIVETEINNILEKNIMINGEYQITTVLENLKNKGLIFKPHTIKKWFDFGTPKNLLLSHAEILKTEFPKGQKFKNTKINPPCYFGNNVTVVDSTIGPNVSVGDGTSIISSSIENTIIQSNSKLTCAKLKDSIIGNNVEYNSGFNSVNIGDYSTFK